MSQERLQLKAVRALSTLLDVYAKNGGDYDAQFNFTSKGAQINISPATLNAEDKNKYKLTEEEVDNLFMNLPSDLLL
ncbi:MAG TPA: hypothetical protein VF185_01585 [Patescibacteria group bacterium]